jgi:D-alanine-D-alanine ligase
MKSKMPKKVLVLYGGTSSEREVSLSSGKAVIAGLEQAGYDVGSFDLQDNITALVAALHPKPDAVFNALHGPGGEDGSIQGLLNLLQIPYTHSGVAASALAMDKVLAKKIFQHNGLPTPPGGVFPVSEILAGDVLPRPYVVKPIREGSSVGVRILHAGDNKPPIDKANWQYGDDAIVEKFIPGREITVAIMGDRALGVTEIKTDLAFYDYQAKYATGGSVHVCPAQIPQAVYERACHIALAAHRVLGCAGVTRSDLRYDDTNGKDELYLLEVNTQPGMTPTSLVPELAAHNNILFPELVAWMVEHATCGA